MGDEPWIVPLMDEDEVRAFDQRIDFAFGVKAVRDQLRIGEAIGIEAARPMFGEQVARAPGAFGLECHRFVPAQDQFTQHAAQEMGVAMIPAGNERMSEIDDLHTAATRAADCLTEVPAARCEVASCR